MTAIIFNNMCTDFKRNKNTYLFMKAKANVSSTKAVQKCQYYYTLSNQSVPLVTIRLNVSLLTEQL